MLTVETSEADELAHSLVQLTGESITEAITVALRERLERERIRRLGRDEPPQRVGALLERLRPAYDRRPVTKAEWDTAAGEDV